MTSQTRPGGRRRPEAGAGRLGHQPNTQIVRGQLELLPNEYIKVKRGEVHGDVDVRGQARGVVNDGGLGAEEMPAGAQRAEHATEVRQQLSDRRARRRHRRRGR